MAGGSLATYAKTSHHSAVGHGVECRTVVRCTGWGVVPMQARNRSSSRCVAVRAVQMWTMLIGSWVEDTEVEAAASSCAVAACTGGESIAALARDHIQELVQSHSGAYEVQYQHIVVGRGSPAPSPEAMVVGRLQATGDWCC